MIFSGQNSFKQVPSFVICTILWRAALNPLSLSKPSAWSQDAMILYLTENWKAEENGWGTYYIRHEEFQNFLPPISKKNSNKTDQNTT